MPLHDVYDKLIADAFVAVEDKNNAIPRNIDDFRLQAQLLLLRIKKQIEKNLAIELNVSNPQRVAAFGAYKEAGFVFTLWKIEQSGFRLIRKYPVRQLDIGVFDSRDEWLVRAMKDDVCYKGNAGFFPTRKDIFSFEASRAEWDLNDVADVIAVGTLLVKAKGHLSL